MTSQPSPSPAPTQTRRSIAAQLSLHYGVTAFGMMLALSVGMYYLVTFAQDRENRGQALSLLDAILDGLDEPGDILHVTEEEPQPPVRYWTRVLDRNLHTISASPGMPGVPLPPSTLRNPLLRAVRVDGLSLLVATDWTRPAAGLPPHLLQVCLDVSDDERLLASYRHVLALALLAGLGLSIATGIWIAQRGLRPLEEIAGATERIDANLLHERLVVSQWPRELSDLAEAYNRMLGRLDHAFQRLSRAASDLAHELRTPLHNLSGEAEVALSRERDPEHYRRVLGSALEEYQRLSHVVDTLLFFARLDNPQHRLGLETFEASDALRKILEFFEPLAAETGVRLELEGHGEIHANPALFGQAVHNLVDNALQHTPAGGVVRAEIHATADRVRVTVRDTGRGIPTDELPQVFERFYRARASREAQLPGSGLGLSIVESILQWHGGYATIDSELGVGTCVTLHFRGPAAVAPNA